MLAVRACAVLVAALTAFGATDSPREQPELVFATNWTPWLEDHLFAWTPGGSLRSLGIGRDVAVSPDGLRLAFLREGQVWVARGDGSRAERVTQEPAANAIASYSPLTWAPDGSRLVYHLLGPTAVVFDLRDRSAVRLDRTIDVAWDPSWRRIAYRADTFPQTIAVAGSDGSTARIVAEGDALGPPVWSPLGTWIAFTGYLGPSRDLWLVRPDGTGLHRLTSDLALEGTPAWSPDGRSLAFARCSDEGRCELRQVDLERAARTLATLPRGVSPRQPFGAGPSWPRRGIVLGLSDGRLLMATPGRRATLLRLPAPADVLTSAPQWQPLARTPRLVLSAHATRSAPVRLATMDESGRGMRILARDAFPSTDPSWSPDGRTIVFVRLGSGSRRGGVYVRTGRTVRRLTSGNDRAPAFSPDGQRIAFSRDRTIRLVRVDGRQARLLRTGLQSQPRQLSWSPDGKTLLYGDAGSIYRLDVASGESRQIPIGSPAFRPIFSPDGSRIAFYSIRDERYFRDPEARGVFLVEPHGTEVRKLATGTFGPTSWSPDGTLLALGDGLRVWIARADGGGTTLLPTRGRSEHASFHPAR